MHELIESDTWEISSECEKLIECLPTLIHDEEPRHEDVLKVDATETTLGDDPYDCARYGLKSYLSPGKKPLENRVAERVEAEQAARVEKGLERQTDPTAVAMMNLKAREQELKKNQPVPLVHGRRGRWDWRHRRGPL